MPERHYTRRIAKRLYTELQASARAASAKLALPREAHDGSVVSRATFIEAVRTGSEADPTYLAKLLDRMAPPAVTTPEGKMVRSETGLKNFHEVIRDARPDVYLAVMLNPEEG